jgi:polyisoprenoid-binding protein YceI
VGDSAAAAGRTAMSSWRAPGLASRIQTKETQKFQITMQTGTQKGFAPLRFLIDKSASRFTVQAFATGMLSFVGHHPTIGLRDFEGELGFVAETYDKAFLRMTLRLAQLDVLDEMKSDDRKKLEQSMYNDVLEVERFPTAVYESSEVTVSKLGGGLLQAHGTGNLSFHGVTQNQSLDARVSDLGGMLRVSGDFSLRQSDFGIKGFSFAGGALRLKDELKFKFELVARKEEEAATNA